MMTILEKGLDLVRREYEKALKNDCIRDPLAYALYQAWKIADADGRRKTGKVDLKNRCGSCAYAEPATIGGSKCYVICTCEEHLNRHCYRGNKINAVRPQTRFACNDYKPKGDVE